MNKILRSSLIVGGIATTSSLALHPQLTLNNLWVGVIAGVLAGLIELQRVCVPLIKSTKATTGAFFF